MWKQKEYGDRKCINCGYLGKKDTQGLGQECFIASAEERTTGNLAHHIIPGILSLSTVPWCSVNRANLKEEVDQLGSQINEVSHIFSIITKDRHCPWWYPWREFSSPKEQYAESVMLAMEKRQQDFQIQMEKDRKEFDLKLFEMSQRIQMDSKLIVESSDRFNRKITILIIALAILEVVGTLLALFFPNGFVR